MSGTALATRRKARAVVLQTLYEVDCTHHDFREILDWLLTSASLPEEAAGFARDMVENVLDNLEVVDPLIQRFASAWPLPQMAAVDRNILRLGIYELLLGVTPAKVAINEAVELAKTFGSENSSKFVNGVLGSVYSGLADTKEKGVK
ncbi:MAG: transcription antitermination factor NusB [Chloroflexi bacterium]|nr:transcription antitermination factor NusB [Chloroflexota bacterium]